LLPVMLLISILFVLVPLAGVAWIVVRGTITTVDGLFNSLILLSIAGIFALNLMWDLRERGLLPFLSKENKAGSKPPSSDES
jgi:hypothetical protein